jgi:hypothetical protein
MKYWDKELIVNEERTKVFARLLKDSKPVIAEVDLQTGALKGPYISLGSNFPKRIRIRSNMIYYMAKQKGGVGYTVYSQEMGE